MARAIARAILWDELYRQRRQLAELSEHLRRDIGLCDADVVLELNRPFWRAWPRDRARLRDLNGPSVGAKTGKPAG